MRTDLPDIIADLYHRLADLERRQQNARRTGTIESVDPDRGVARVRLNEDAKDGKPYLTAEIPWKMPSNGAVSVNIPPSVGQQVDVVSESGDLTDAMIDASLRSDANPLPGAKPGEAILTTGDTTLFITGSKIRAVTGTFEVEANVTIKGNITHQGDYTQDGVHVDSNGPHTA